MHEAESTTQLPHSSPNHQMDAKRRKRTGRKRTVFKTTPRPAWPVRGLWEAAPAEEKQRAHKTCMPERECSAGVLARQEVQGGGRDEPGREPSACLAAQPDGALRHDGGAPDPAAQTCGARSLRGATAGVARLADAQDPRAGEETFPHRGLGSSPAHGSVGELWIGAQETLSVGRCEVHGQAIGPDQASGSQESQEGGSQRGSKTGSGSSSGPRDTHQKLWRRLRMRTE